MSKNLGQIYQGELLYSIVVQQNNFIRREVCLSVCLPACLPACLSVNIRSKAAGILSILKSLYCAFILANEKNQRQLDCVSAITHFYCEVKYCQVDKYFVAFCSLRAEFCASFTTLYLMLCAFW